MYPDLKDNVHHGGNDASQKTQSTFSALKGNLGLQQSDEVSKQDVASKDELKAKAAEMNK